MGHSQADKAITHERIVTVAARRYRERGMAGFAIADVMKEAGLTVGGFYKHFTSREALIAAALLASFKELDAWEAEAQSVEQILREKFLTPEHRDDPGSGCAICALVDSVAKGTTDTRATYTARVKRSVALSESLLDLETARERRARALLLLSASVGAIGLSRAISDPDFSNEILSMVADQLAALAQPRTLQA